MSVIQLWVRVHPVRLMGAAVLPWTAWRTIAVAFVQLIHDRHSFNDFAERRKPPAVQLAVIAEIDEELSGSGVGTSRGERNRAADIRVARWVIRDARGLHFSFTFGSP